MGPRRPTASFQPGKKQRTQRSPACGPFASPSNPRNDLRLARGSLSGPLDNLRLARGWWIYPRAGDSSPPHSRAPLGTLDRATYLCLARGSNSFPLRSRPPLGTKDEQPRLPTVRRTKALNASHSATAPRTGGVRPPLPQWMRPGSHPLTSVTAPPSRLL